MTEESLLKTSLTQWQTCQLLLSWFLLYALRRYITKQIPSFCSFLLHWAFSYYITISNTFHDSLSHVPYTLMVSIDLIRHHVLAFRPPHLDVLNLPLLLYFISVLCVCDFCLHECLCWHSLWGLTLCTWEIPYRAIPGKTRSPRERMQGAGIIKHPPGYCTQPTPLSYPSSRDAALSPSGLVQKQGSYPPWVYFFIMPPTSWKTYIPCTPFGQLVFITGVPARNSERCKEDFPPQGVWRVHL